MCGFVGVALKSGTLNREAVYRANQNIKHRGPDGEGHWFSPDLRVSLAHRRLSILDITEGSSQPMHHGLAGLSLVFNGEIYNHQEVRRQLEGKGHKFRTRGDTEVILIGYVEWGADLVNNLNGMFSFAIYDSIQNRIFCARDRIGEKPFYFSHNENAFMFGSELKSLFELTTDLSINKEALSCYLAKGFVPGDQCIVSGFEKLPPSHALTYDINTSVLKTWQYWHVPVFQNNIAFDNLEEVVEQLEFLLDKSVANQLQADVPVGVLLSGGVDSSLVTAIASRKKKDLMTFSVSFPKAGIYDESEYARLISSHFNTKHLELNCEDNFALHLPEILAQFDEPMVDSSMLPMWALSRQVKNYCKVVLGGDGGDEVFGGYAHYQNFHKLASLFGGKFLPLRRLSSNVANTVLPIGCKGRSYFDAFGADLNSDTPQYKTLFDADWIKRLTHGMWGSGFRAQKCGRFHNELDGDLIYRCTVNDLRNYLPEDILVKVDRASMHHGLEVRSPFLDKELVEFAFAMVHSKFKVKSSDRKILLRTLARKLLPNNFDFKRKQGFSIPINNWLKAGPFRDFFWDILTSKTCVFDTKHVRRLLSEQDIGFKHGERIFALAQFQFWRDYYNVSL